MISVIHSALIQEDVVGHPAKKARSCEGSYRSSILEPPLHSGLAVKIAKSSSEIQGKSVESISPNADADNFKPSVGSSPAQTQLETLTFPVQEALATFDDARGKPIPERLRSQPPAETVELAGSLDGWLGQHMNLPSLKLFKRNESDPHASSCTDVRPDSGFGSPIPGSPQWFRLQPSTCQHSRASPSIDIEILSPVVPEAYPEEDADMVTESDDCTFGPASHSPRHGCGRSSSPSTPRKRGPSRLGWGASPLKESLVQCQAADASFNAPSHPDTKSFDSANAAPADDCSMHSPQLGHNQENALDSRTALRCDGHDTLEMQALEARFVQMLQAGGGCLPVAMALPLFRDYMFDEKDKDAVRGMLTRWCTVRDSPQGGERWLLMRSSFEQQGLQCPA